MKVTEILGRGGFLISYIKLSATSFKGGSITDFIGIRSSSLNSMIPYIVAISYIIYRDSDSDVISIIVSGVSICSS